VLTGIVVSVALTGFALALIIKIYEEYGTLDAEKLIKG
jgi:multisubunit Na+/H+ antiporter MnhC subunit